MSTKAKDEETHEKEWMKDERTRQYLKEMEEASKERPINRKCHDCDVKPGQMHKEGCDSPRCTICGTQLLQCGHWKYGNSVHTGIESQELMILCEAMSLLCKWVEDGFTMFEGTKLPQGHWAKCGRDDPEATYDLNEGVAIWYHSLKAVRTRVKEGKD